MTTTRLGWSATYVMRNGKWRAVHIAQGDSKEEAETRLARYVRQHNQGAEGELPGAERDDRISRAWRRLRERVLLTENEELIRATADFAAAVRS